MPISERIGFERIKTTRAPPPMTLATDPKSPGSGMEAKPPATRPATRLPSALPMKSDAHHLAQEALGSQLRDGAEADRADTDLPDRAENVEADEPAGADLARTAVCVHRAPGHHEKPDGHGAQSVRELDRQGGLAEPSRSQSIPESGEKMITRSALTVRNQEAGISQPPINRSVSWEAKRFIEEPACSKPDQKSAVAAKKTKTAATRFFSVPSSRPRRRR